MLNGPLYFSLQKDVLESESEITRRLGAETTRAGDGAGTLALPASTAGFPSRFFKVFSADSEVPAGTLLSALSGDD